MSIESDIVYSMSDVIRVVSGGRRFCLFAQRHWRGDHSNRDCRDWFVLHDSFAALCESIDEMIERHCWDDWSIDWVVKDNQIGEWTIEDEATVVCTIVSPYQRATLEVSTLDKDECDVVEALLAKKKAWKCAGGNDCKCYEEDDDE